MQSKWKTLWRRLRITFRSVKLRAVGSGFLSLLYAFSFIFAFIAKPR